MLDFRKSLIYLAIFAAAQLAPNSQLFAQDPSSNDSALSLVDQNIGCSLVDCERLRPWADVSGTTLDPKLADSFAQSMAHFTAYLDLAYEYKFPSSVDSETYAVQRDRFLRQMEKMNLIGQAHRFLKLVEAEDRESQESVGILRTQFLRLVEENFFQAEVLGLGNFETKLIDGQVVIKFVPKAGYFETSTNDDGEAVKKFVADDSIRMAALFYNVDCRVNKPVPLIQDDSAHLDRYLAKLALNADRTVLSFDMSRGEEVTPENSKIVRKQSFLTHPIQATQLWIKATIQKPKPGNFSLAAMSAPVQLLLAVGAIHLAHEVHAKPVDYYSAYAAFTFAAVLCTFSDIYNNIVERGKGILTGENTRRFVIGLFLTVPLWGHEHGWNSFDATQLSSWMPGGAYFTLMFLGWTDRWASVTWNQIFKDMHDKYRLDPWFGIAKRVPMPFRAPLSYIFNDPKIKDATMKGTQIEREGMAVARFIPKILAITVAPIAGNVALAVWALGGELATHLAADHYAQKKPQMEEIAMKYAWRRYKLLGLIPGARKLADRWAEKPILGIKHPFKFRVSCKDAAKALGQLAP